MTTLKLESISKTEALEAMFTGFQVLLLNVKANIMEVEQMLRPDPNPAPTMQIKVKRGRQVGKKSKRTAVKRSRNVKA